jgi:protein TonB
MQPPSLSLVPPLERAPPPWRWGAFSVVLHALVIFALVWDWSGPPAMVASLTPGGPGPAGGGGGGGGPRITYVLIPAYQPPPKTPQPQQKEVRPEEVVIPKPVLQQVEIQQPVFEIPKAAQEAGGPVIGQGPGTGGGPGAGTGTGGGIGSGRGTGMGSGVGPGTGGQGGDIFPPSPRYVILPPMERPQEVRGKEIAFRLTVDVDGRVVGVEIQPRIRNAEFRQRLLEQVYQWTFAPAYTREGVLVRSEIVVTLTL